MLLSEVRQKVNQPIEESWKQNLLGAGLAGVMAMSSPHARAADVPPNPFTGGGAGLTPFDGNGEIEYSPVDPVKFFDTLQKLKANNFELSKLYPKDQRLDLLKKKYPTPEDRLLIYQDWFGMLQKEMKAAGEKDINANTLILCYLLGGVKNFQQFKAQNGVKFGAAVPKPMMDVINGYNGEKIIAPPKKR